MIQINSASLPFLPSGELEEEQGANIMLIRSFKHTFVTLATLHLIACGWYLMACEPGGLDHIKCYQNKWGILGDRRANAIVGKDDAIYHDHEDDDDHEEDNEQDVLDERGKKHSDYYGVKFNDSSKIGIPSMFSTFMFNDVDIYPTFMCFPAIPYQLLKKC